MIRILLGTTPGQTMKRTKNQLQSKSKLQTTMLFTELSVHSSMIRSVGQILNTRVRKTKNAFK